MRRGAAGRRAAAGIALALAFLAVAPARGAGAAAPRRFVGLNYAFYPHVPLGAARRMAAGGVRSVRFALAWFQVERSRGTYDWSTADRTIGDLASQGIDPVPVLFGTPYWASDLTVLPPPLGVPVPTLGLYAGMGTAEPPNATAIGRKAWPRFVGAAVRRYGHGGAYWHGPYQLEHPGAVPRPVRAWQVWNEPNIATYFWPRPSVTRYADLVRISHRAIASN